ncbi:MAG: O-antigen ligase family protein [Desulfobacteraceae bacterium]|nr:O-antigen ligase family protein [Desulfobacteraceae bacterium]
MGKILLAIIIASTVSVSLFRPWIGVIAYYLLALLGPQYIWWWNFEGLRVSLWVGGSAILGVAIHALHGQYDFKFLKTRQNFWVLLLFCFIFISYFFGPYVSSAINKSSFFNPDKVFNSATKIFLFYFCATLAINDFKKLRFFCIIFIISTIYLIYWANLQYFTENWNQFNMGRLMGPMSIDEGSIYRDENAFAMFFVTGVPFIYFMGVYVLKNWFRYVLWAIIPLGWHAIFLTGSRGGLVGLGAIIFFSLLQSKKKILSLLIIPLFIFAYQWQAGDIMKERTETIADYQGESSAEARLIAWRAGFKMITDYPFTGVGLSSFMSAFPFYSYDNPRVAHNTFVQFAAESGVGAGLSYLLIALTFFLSSRRIKKWCKDKQEHPDIQWIQYSNDASTVSFSGLIVCSLFLSLNFYEIFFYLLIINNSLAVLCSSTNEEDVAIPASI